MNQLTLRGCNITSSDNGTTATILLDTAITIDDTHEHWDEILGICMTPTNRLTEQDYIRLEELLYPERHVRNTFTRVTDRVTIENGHVYYNHDRVDDRIAELMIIASRNGNDEEARALGYFMERLQANPSKVSREQLFNWMENRSFHITYDGRIVAYKGVNPTRTNGNQFLSSHAGCGFVNDEYYENTNLPNNPGDVVAMPRSDVNDDRSVGCSTGLHVGTWRYASGFATTTISVVVDPEDVVSVPSDASEQKMRVCRYEVVEHVTRPYTDDVFFDISERVLAA